jgi:DedD protein
VAATPAAAIGAWWVQLGSFASEQNAQGLARKLRDRGFSIDVSKVRSGSRDLYRVRAGPERNRDAATALRSKLAAAGTQGTLVAP